MVAYRRFEFDILGHGMAIVDEVGIFGLQEPDCAALYSVELGFALSLDT